MRILEELCNFADRCAVDSTKSEICSNGYVQCRIYHELIKYKKEYLCPKKEELKEYWMLK